MKGEDTDVVIVGSGPYALSLAAHLQALRVEYRAFGPPMRFWLDMPVGINLKSYGFATNVYVPMKGHRFPEWCQANALEGFEPCPMESFARYGLWVKDRLISDLDPSLVRAVSRDGAGFEVKLADERRVRARRVVFATGLSHLAYVPESLASLPADTVSHTSDHRSYASFRGKDVAVVGGGASAIEAGALIHEAGGRPVVLVRDEVAHFGTRLKNRRSLLDRMRRPNSVFGPGMKGRLLQALPLSVRLMPEQKRIALVRNSFGPSSPWWITTRVWGRVPIFVQTQVLGAQANGSRIRLRVGEQGHGERDMDVDHVVAGTGYVSDVDRVAYLDASLRKDMRRVDGAPWLTLNFESSVSGAYFVGPIAANCFGPLFRFVAGAEYAAPSLARHLAGPIRSVSHAVRRAIGHQASAS